MEINGKGLKELELWSSLNLSIDRFCPNLKILSIIISNDLKQLENILTIVNNEKALKFGKMMIIRMRGLLEIVANVHLEIFMNSK